MANLQHSLDNARAEPEKDFHLAIELNRLFEEIERTENIDEDTRIEIEELDDELNISEICFSLEQWYSDHEIQSFRDVQPLLRDGITHAIDKGWENIAVEYHFQLIYLRANLSGHNPDTEIREALEFLKNNQQDISSNRIIRVIDLMSNNLDSVDDDRTDEWKSFVQSAIDQARSNKQFDKERSLLRKLHDVKSENSEDTTSIENSLIRTYEMEASFRENNSSLMKADILRSGLNECGEYMSEEKREDWKKEALEARKTGTEDEMGELNLDDLPVYEDDRDLVEELNKEMRNNITIIKDFFNNLKEEYDSKFAFYCLLQSEGIIPDTTKMNLDNEQFVFQSMISTKVISPEYHTFSQDTSSVENIPQNYQVPAISQMNATFNAIYQLIKEGDLTFNDFVWLLRISNSLSPDTEAFLTESIIDMMDENHVQSLFVSLPHLEGAIVDTLSAVGKTTYKNMETGTQQRNLGGLILETDAFDKDYSTYLRYRYTSQEGMNLRNRAVHGLLRYVNANYLNSVMVLYDIMKVMLEINPSPYVRVFGPPARTLSPSTNYGKELDLSLYTDANKQILGYGESDDSHTLVVIRKDRTRDRTELFVDKGKISEYKLGEEDMSKNDMVDAIDDLSDEYVEIPSGIEYKWFDDEKILSEVKDIITNQSGQDLGKIQKESIFKQAQQRGIDESTVRMVFVRLEDEGKITQEDDTISVNN